MKTMCFTRQLHEDNFILFIYLFVYFKQYLVRVPSSARLNMVVFVCSLGILLFNPKQNPFYWITDGYSMHEKKT